VKKNHHQEDFDIQSTTHVNPFNPSSFTARPLLTPKEEEDFTIKPHLMFSQDDHQHTDEKRRPAEMYGCENPTNMHDPQHHPSYQMEMMMHYQQNQHYQQLQYQHYLESQKHHQTHQMMIRTCPVHGEGNQYKQTLEMMQSQAHAYAFSCFLYFQHMAKTAKTPEEKAYYLHQQGVAGCMVHGPHGISPVGIPQPPALGQYGI
jgi:hypothetical protein